MDLIRKCIDNYPAILLIIYSFVGCDPIRHVIRRHTSHQRLSLSALLEYIQTSLFSRFFEAYCFHLYMHLWTTSWHSLANLFVSLFDVIYQLVCHSSILVSHKNWWSWEKLTSIVRWSNVCYSLFCPFALLFVFFSSFFLFFLQLLSISSPIMATSVFMLRFGRINWSSKLNSY